MRCTVQGLIRRHLEGYASRQRMPIHHWKAVRQLARCRTAALGGHVRRCPNGHVEGVWYNSCHHRWCPQCNGLATERWLERQRARLLGCAHRHLVFTLPSELRAVFRRNEAVMSEALFASVKETVLELVGDARHVGGVPGVMLARHTWARSLAYHPHVHCLVSEGGLDATGRWREPRRACFLPARVVVALFRGKYLAKVRGLAERGALVLGRGESPERFGSELNRLGRVAWHVRVGERYGHGAGVATYLARYMRGGALRDGQLRECGDGRIELRYRSRRGEPGARVRRLRLEPEALLGRYLAHVPRARSRLVRCYGLYAGSCAERLRAARAALGEPAPTPAREPLDWLSYLERVGASRRRLRCRRCGAVLHLGEPVAPIRAPP